ncbi:MAG: hypothetical protein PHC28_04945 [Flavobacterium sp.]|uniref:hypothetical protein n=1 Tax=Flavobacterium sp. TaxID=239 RepID=UPI0026116CA5|nr:hypothetical protein [Flavobacterium sp.]MDD5149813.1 hypothetical protein [Flavobacterium sp.]
MVPSNFTPTEICKIINTLTRDELEEQFIKYSEEFELYQAIESRSQVEDSEIDTLKEDNIYYEELIKTIKNLLNKSHEYTKDEFVDLIDMHISN